MSRDIVVLGGGISGLGVAYEAAKKGHRVTIIEKDQLGSGTSANSHKIIHGGFRYLKEFNLSRVIESIKAQKRIFQEFPDCVEELKCIMPLSSGLQGKYPVKIATILYKLIATLLNGSAVSSPLVINSSLTYQFTRDLRISNKKNSLLWSDGLLKDHFKLVTILKEKISGLSVTILENTEATEITKNDSKWQVFFRNKGENGDLIADIIVNTLGSEIEKIKGRPIKNTYNWCFGFNIILPKLYEENIALGLRSKTGRILFFVPRDNGTAIGTGYIDTNDSGGKLREAYVRKFFNEAIECIGESNSFKYEDIKKTEIGILPYRGIDSNGEPILIGKEEIQSVGGYIEVLSTKYTTFLTQAKKVLDIIER